VSFGVVDEFVQEQRAAETLRTGKDAPNVTYRHLCLRVGDTDDLDAYSLSDISRASVELHLATGLIGD